MPKGILYILLFAYSISLLRPVLPYVSDLAAHVFWYSKHMATVHYENGKFHIHKDLSAAADNDAPGKNLPASKKTDNGAEHILFTSTRLMLPITVGLYADNSTPDIIFIPHNIELPPPRA
jgi:hypothetical protein